MPFHHVTEKRLELARKAALARLRKNMDAVITAAALDMTINSDDLVKDHIAAEQRRLSLLSAKRPDLKAIKLNVVRYKKPNEAVLSAVAAEAPTFETLRRETADRFNTAAEGIDERLGFSIRMSTSDGWLTFRWRKDEDPKQTEYNFHRGLEALLFLSVLERLGAQMGREDYPLAKDQIAAAEDRATTYEWMLDTFSLMLVTPKGIERQAHARDGLWNTKLRKTKQGVAMKRLAFQRDVELALTEAERERLLKEFHRVIRAKHHNAQDQIRRNPEFKDFVLSRWLPIWNGVTPKPVTDEMIDGITGQSGDQTG